VPQGSVLGPLLFIVFINNIDTVCCGKTVLQLFADDAKLYSNINIDNSCLTLQQSLDSLVRWAKEWQLSINISKCAVLSLTSKPQPVLYIYLINNIAISRRDSHVDLGITISSDLSFDTHINGIVSKVRQRVSTLLRGFLSRNLSTMRLAFITYIRPILEYNCIVWSPNLIHLIDLIENVQRNFTKRLRFIQTAYDVVRRRCGGSSATPYDVVRRRTTSYDAVRRRTAPYDVVRRRTTSYDVVRRRSC
jgi:ribonuclease P/MRP protein subunit RPP40